MLYICSLWDHNTVSKAISAHDRTLKSCSIYVVNLKFQEQWKHVYLKFQEQWKHMIWFFLLRKRFFKTNIMLYFCSFLDRSWTSHNCELVENMVTGFSTSENFICWDIDQWDCKSNSISPFKRYSNRKQPHFWNNYKTRRKWLKITLCLLPTYSTPQRKLDFAGEISFTIKIISWNKRGNKNL